MDAKEVLIEKATESLGEIQKWVESGKDFVVEQAPLVVHEIIAWGIAECTFFLVLNGIIIITALIMLYCSMFRKKMLENVWFDENMRRANPTFHQIQSIVGSAVGIMGTIISFANICGYTYFLLFIVYAPRLYILQELSKLLK